TRPFDCPPYCVFSPKPNTCRPCAGIVRRPLASAKAISGLMRPGLPSAVPGDSSTTSVDLPAVEGAAAGCGFASAAVAGAVAGAAPGCGLVSDATDGGAAA